MIQQYMLRIVAACLIGGAVKRLLPEKGTAGDVGRLLTGLFLAVTILSPLTSLRLPQGEDLFSDLRLQAQAAVNAGESATANALREGIKQRTEAYILDKAESLACEIAVEVTLSDDPIPVPVAVRLSGNISPYAKGQLQAMLCNELGIAKEAQQWT